MTAVTTIASVRKANRNEPCFRVLHAPDARTLSGLLAEPLAAHDRLGRLLSEGLLELRE